MGRTSDAREKILGAGQSLIELRGYSALGVAEICKTAGVPKGSFYYFFESKEALALAVLDRHWDDQRRAWQRVLTADAENGAADHGPFDRIVVTVQAADIPPAWIGQLKDGGRLVVPLRMRGMTRTVAFVRYGDRLVSDGFELCGFVPMQGAGENRFRLAVLHDKQGEEIALRSPLAVREVKRLVDDALDRDLASGHEAEVEASVRIFATDDLLEGARSFVEKREPQYRGR